MAHAQWVSLTITSEGTTFSIKNANLKQGKFHETGNKDHEISDEEINNITIESGQSAVINSCGHSESQDGTEGSFDIFDGEVKVGEYYWYCPWGSNTNDSRWTQSHDHYLIEVCGVNLHSAALGNISIRCVTR